jgi:hypothetical protein
MYPYIIHMYIYVEYITYIYYTNIKKGFDKLI